MAYTLIEIATITHGYLYGSSNHEIEHLSIDSRNIIFAHSTLFIALAGKMSDGHDYIDHAYHRGVRMFLVNNLPTKKYDDANFVKVENSLTSLQLIAKYHRLSNKQTKIIGITGSNGKTIIKEWLAAMIAKDHFVVKNPSSYNSQIGVPLSIWQLKPIHEYGIFEAGISTIHEMEKLQTIIQPHIGIFTNIGHAHDAGFNNRLEKIKEKAKLFIGSDKIICCRDHDDIIVALTDIYSHVRLFTWGFHSDSYIQIKESFQSGNKTVLTLFENNTTISLTLPVTDSAAIENAMHCVACLRYLGYDFWQIEELVAHIGTLDMRLEIKEGISNSLIINDAYSNDLTSLEIALKYQQKHGLGRKKIVILSEMQDTGMDAYSMKISIQNLLKQFELYEIHLIGDSLRNMEIHNCVTHSYSDTYTFIEQLNSIEFTNSIVLIKGARVFQFEKIDTLLAKQSHSTMLTIDLAALEHNLSIFASQLTGQTSLICVIKAGAYGSGSEEIAKVLQHKGVEYLAVAFADEGSQLRKAGISIPIMVLNPDEESIADMIRYKLEPEVYDVTQLETILKYLNAQEKKLTIHLKLDSGMSRLGFQENLLDKILPMLKNERLHVATIFSHLASSEDNSSDAFTHQQASRFLNMYEVLCSQLNYRPQKHLLNSSGIHRFKQYQFDYVRLGIGLYGIDPNESMSQSLEKVHTLTAKIIQIKRVKKGDSVGYNQKHIVQNNSIIAILNIGYADGLLRVSGNGNYCVFINGALAPIISNVCMDLTIIDVTHISDISVGHVVEIFGKNNAIETLAKVCNTIPYEILTRISPRIKRRFLN